MSEIASATGRMRKDDWMGEIERGAGTKTGHRPCCPPLQRPYRSAHYVPRPIANRCAFGISPPQHRATRNFPTSDVAETPRAPPMMLPRSHIHRVISGRRLRRRWRVTGWHFPRIRHACRTTLWTCLPLPAYHLNVPFQIRTLYVSPLTPLSREVYVNHPPGPRRALFCYLLLKFILACVNL